MTEITAQFLEQIRGNQRIRQRLAFESPLWFSLIYLQHHFRHPLAPFHLEMFRMIENDEYEFVVIMAFRESGKSTIMNMANILWSILGKPEKKFAVVISKTQEQAKNHFANIKMELVNNELLRADFGPFTENEREWNKLSLELDYRGSKVLSLTRNQSVRGLKHGRFRPDLIVCDDLEDTHPENSQREMLKDAKDLYQHFSDEILTVGSAQTRIVVLGNLISEHSFIMNLRKEILDGEKKIFRAYPLLDDNGKCLWAGKFSDTEDITASREKMPPGPWIRECLLKVVDENQHEFFMPGEIVFPPERFGFSEEYGAAVREIRAAMRNIGTPQKALIGQMGGFTISAPCRVSFPPEEDKLYLKYNDIVKKILVIVRKEWREEIVRRINEMP